MGYELRYFSLVLAFCKCKTDDLGCEERRIKVFGGDESILNHLHFSNAMSWMYMDVCFFVFRVATDF